MKKKQKPDFSIFPFSRHAHFSPIGGNNIGYVAPIAIITLDEKMADDEDKKAYEEAKKIYDEKIFVGARFKAGTVNGQKNNNDKIGIITYISAKTFYVTWDFDNKKELEEKYNTSTFKLKWKPQKWSVAGIISMIQSGYIEMLEK